MIPDFKVGDRFLRLDSLNSKKALVQDTNRRLGWGSKMTPKIGYHLQMLGTDESPTFWPFIEYTNWQFCIPSYGTVQHKNKTMDSVHFTISKKFTKRPFTNYVMQLGRVGGQKKRY